MSEKLSEHCTVAEAEEILRDFQRTNIVSPTLQFLHQLIAFAKETGWQEGDKNGYIRGREGKY